VDLLNRLCHLSAISLEKAGTQQHRDSQLDGPPSVGGGFVTALGTQQVNALQLQASSFILESPFKIGIVRQGHLDRGQTTEKVRTVWGRQESDSQDMPFPFHGKPGGALADLGIESEGLIGARLTVPKAG